MDDITGSRQPIPPTRPEPVVPERPAFNLTPFNRQSVTPPERQAAPQPTPAAPAQPPVQQRIAPPAPTPQIPQYEPQPAPAVPPQPRTLPLKKTSDKKAHAIRLPRLPRKVAVIGGVLCTLLLVGGAYMTFFAPHNNKPKVLGNNAQATADDVQNLRQGTPDYKTMLPAGKTIDQLGGWTRVSPSGTEPVYAYVDKIKGIQINVSQQPLPYEFDDDSTDQHIEELASGYNADQKMKVGGTTVYIGTSAKGPQSVIFTRDKILVLIKSLSAIDNNSWAAYISSLK